MDVTFKPFNTLIVKVGDSTVEIHFGSDWTWVSARVPELPLIHFRLYPGYTEAIESLLWLVKNQDLPMLAFVGLFWGGDFHESRYIRDVMETYERFQIVPERLKRPYSDSPRREWDTVANVKRVFRHAIKDSDESLQEYILKTSRYLLELPCEPRVHRAIHQGITRLVSESL